MEVDCVYKPIIISESARMCFDDFDSAVDAFLGAVAHLEDNCIVNFP